MPNKKTHDVVATVGTFTTPKGDEKKRYQNCGVAFTNENGQLSIKLNAVPVNPDWSGWLNLYPSENDNRPQNQQTQTQQQPQRQAPQRNFQDDDDIPF